jgi:hypothetical protein
VLEVRSEITLIDAAYINTAFRCERHAQLAQRWLAMEAESMTPGDRLNYSREVARASAERDKAIAALRLDERSGFDDLWNGTLPSPGCQSKPIAAANDQPAGESGDAAAARLDGHGSDSNGDGQPAATNANQSPAKDSPAASQAA